MGNVFGKYAEWEINEDEEQNEEGGATVEEMVVETPVEANVEQVPITAEPNVEVAVESEVSPKPRRRSSGNLGKSNSDVSPNASTQHSPLPRGRRTNSGLKEANVESTTAPTTTATEGEATEASPKPRRGRTNSGLKAATVETPSKPTRGRTNSGLKAAPLVEEPIEEITIEQQQETVENVETAEQESPVAKKIVRRNSSSTTKLKRKRTGSISGIPTVSVEEEKQVIEEEVPKTPVTEKRVTKKRATSPKPDAKVAIKAEEVGGTIPYIIDPQNYAKLTREELSTQPRRSLRQSGQTPLKDISATPKSVKKSRAPKSPVKLEKVERSPSPKRKLSFTTPKKKDASPTQTPTRRGRKPTKKNGSD